ncbi:MAG: RidA family protein [Hyphomicrobium sp.]
MNDDIEQRLKTLGIELPSAPTPVANYVPTIISLNVLYVSGQIARAADGTLLTGCVGEDLTVEEGQAAARLCALNILAQAKSALGSLNRISQVLRINGYVHSHAGFADQPKVINGASDLLVQILNEKGRHTRAAIGVSGLPGNSAVEIDAIIAIR